MGQKIAAYNAQGAIIAFYDSVDSPAPEGVDAIQITDDEWQYCISNQGAKIVAKGALADAPPPDPAVVLASEKTAKISSLAAACQAQIIGGFSSSATGTATTYPSQNTAQNPDQLNLQSAAMASQGQADTWTTPLWCEQAGGWAFVSHTAAQVQKVNVDWVTFRSAAQQQYAAAVELVSAATTVDAVQAVGGAA